MPFMEKDLVGQKYVSQMTEKISGWVPPFFCASFIICKAGGHGCGMQSMA